MNLNQHHIPDIFQKFPVLIRIIWVFRCSLFPRVGVIQSFLRKYRKTTGLAVDLGAGDGQFLPRVQSNHKNYFAVDLSEDHIRLIKGMNPNVSAIKANIENWMDEVETGQLNWIQCISTMQYLTDPSRFMENCYRSLTPGGMVFLYVPLHQKQELRVYRWVFGKFSNYENLNRRLHIFNMVELVKAFTNQGFKIVEFHSTYHFWGRISHELLSIGLIFLSQKAIGIKMLGLIWFVFNLPLILLFNLMEALGNDKVKVTDGGVIREIVNDTGVDMGGQTLKEVSACPHLLGKGSQIPAFNGGVFVLKK